MDNKADFKKEGITGKTGKTQLVVAFILGLVVGVLVAPTFFGNNGTVDEVLLDDDGEVIVEEEVVATDGTNAVVVSDQLAGDRVLIKEITLDASGWAVVHEDVEGAPGNALGAQRFDVGKFESGYVDLLRNTESNNLYYVLLYADNGDGEFDIKTDSPIQDGEQVVSTAFETITIDRKNN